MPRRPVNAVERPSSRRTPRKKPGDEVEKYTLTPKQKLFISEYLVDFNATQAAIRAGYSALAPALKKRPAD